LSRFEGALLIKTERLVAIMPSALKEELGCVSMSRIGAIAHHQRIMTKEQ
jgi:hypothetical protein